MDMTFSELAPMLSILGILAIGGWILTTWLRIKHGYPLDGHKGEAVYPQKNEELIERVKQLSSDNARLRDDLASIKDRLATVERIVTDDGHRLTQEIEALRLPAN